MNLAKAWKKKAKTAHRMECEWALERARTYAAYDTVKAQNDRLYKIIDAIFKGETKIATIMWHTHQDNK